MGMLICELGRALAPFVFSAYPLAPPCTGWDLAWPEAFRSLLLQGVEVVIAPTCWLGSDGADVGLAHDERCEEKFLESLVVTRAFENECVVVFVNCGGKKEDGWIGGSGVAVPFKGWVGKAVSDVEQHRSRAGLC